MKLGNRNNTTTPPSTRDRRMQQTQTEDPRPHITIMFTCKSPEEPKAAGSRPHQSLAPQAQVEPMAPKHSRVAQDLAATWTTITPDYSAARARTTTMSHDGQGPISPRPRPPCTHTHMNTQISPPSVSSQTQSLNFQEAGGGGGHGANNPSNKSLKFWTNDKNVSLLFLNM